jgi:hypothetical protein
MEPSILRVAVPASTSLFTTPTSDGWRQCTAGAGIMGLNILDRVGTMDRLEYLDGSGIVGHIVLELGGTLDHIIWRGLKLNYQSMYCIS